MPSGVEHQAGRHKKEACVGSRCRSRKYQYHRLKPMSQVLSPVDCLILRPLLPNPPLPTPWRPPIAPPPTQHATPARHLATTPPAID